MEDNYKITCYTITKKKPSTFVNKENVLKSEIKRVNEFKRGPRRGGGIYSLYSWEEKGERKHFNTVLSLRGRCLRG